MDNNPIKRDLNTTTGNVFGNITDIPNLANLMQDPLGTEIVAGLTGPIAAQSLPTDEEDVMGQPPQVNFDGGAGSATPMPTPADDDSPEVRNEIMEAEWFDSMMSRIKSLNWKWITGAVVVSGVLIVGGKKVLRK